MSHVEEHINLSHSIIDCIIHSTIAANSKHGDRHANSLRYFCRCSTGRIPQSVIVGRFAVTLLQLLSVGFDTIGTLTESQGPCGSFLQVLAPVKIARIPVFPVFPPLLLPLLLHARDSSLPRLPGRAILPLPDAQHFSPLIWLRILLAYEENPEKGIENS